MKNVAAASGDWDKAVWWEEQALELYQDLGDKWATAAFLTEVGSRAARIGEYAKARRLAGEGLALRRALGDQWGTANTLAILGSIAIAQGHIEEAERFVRQSIATRHKTGIRSIESGSSHLVLASVLRRSGRFGEARAVCRDTQSLCHEFGLSGWSSLELGMVELHLGEYDGARSAAQTTSDDSRESGDIRGVGVSLEILGRAALAEERNNEARQLLKKSVTAHRAAGQPQWLAEALASLGLSVCVLGEFTAARAHLSEALLTGTETRDLWAIVETLPAFAHILVDEGKIERAVELYALASRYPYVANSQWFEDVVGKHIAAVSATLSPGVVSAEQQRGRARDLWETAEQLLEELEGEADDA
jgi:tetratricopeptide (TPR) repeat protein